MKRSRLKRITNAEKKHQKILYIQQMIGVVFLGILAAVVLWGALHSPDKSILDPRGSSKVKTVEIKADEPVRYCGDVISYIRCAGEDAGLPNEDIRKLIRIAKCESGYKPDAKNGTSSATGIFQFLWGTWDSNRCPGEKWDSRDNTDCAIKVYKLRGDQPWHASEACWNK
jgi:hypothetical protein